MLAVASGKGGTGKTTLALALGHMLAAAHKVDAALLDLDPQAGLTDYAGLEPSDDPLREEPSTAHGLRVYRGGRPLAHASEREVGRHLERAVAASGLVVADLSPAWGDAAHRVVLARELAGLVLAVRLDGGGLKAAQELAGLAQQRNVPFRIVPTFAKRWAISQTVLKSLRAFYGDRVTTTVVPEESKAAECVAAGEPVTVYAPRSRVAEAVRALTDELAATMLAPEGRRPRR